MSAMRNPPAQVTAFIPGKLGIDEMPGWLIRHAATIAGNTNHVVFCQALKYTIGKEIIIDPHIVVSEHENVRTTLSGNSRIEDVWKTKLICKRNLRHKTGFILQPL
jgi:hypothetical protein